MKIKLSETDIRKITRRVLLKNMLIEEKISVTGDKPKQKKELSKKVSKKITYEDIVNSDNTDNLAVKESGSAGRGGDYIAAATAAGGVSLGVATAAMAPSLTAVGLQAGLLGGGSAAAAATVSGGAAVGTAGATGSLAAGIGLASNPVGWVIGGVIIGAGLYYAFSEDSTGSDATKEALDTTLYKRVASAFKKIYLDLRNSDIPEVKAISAGFNPDKCLVVPNELEAMKFAEEFYNATQGGTFGLGLGTDEDAIEATILKCRSYLGLSRVSFKHAKAYEGTFVDDGDLLKVFTGELDKSDMERYVNSVIPGLPYIIIKTGEGETEYTKEEFQQWLVDTKEAADSILQGVTEEEPDQDDGAVISENADYVLQIQGLINKYCTAKDLEFAPLKEDGKWGKLTNALWQDIYLPHVFENHSVFSKLGIDIGDGKWETLSKKLIGKFPGYTPGQKGCLNFCIDALNNNTKMGEQEGGKDSPIRYYMGGGSRSRRNREKESKQKSDDKPEKGSEESAEKPKPYGYIPPSGDGRLSYKNIKIDVDIIGDRNIRKLSQLPRAPKDSDVELKYDFLTNFGTQRLDLPAGETFQLNIVPKPDGKIKFSHRSTKLFKAHGIREFAEPFHRFFKGLNLTKTELKQLKIDDKSPIVIKLIMPKGLYNPATDR